MLIESKTFTNGADRVAVKALFRKMSINQLGGITALDFDGMSPPSVEGARRLGGCLNLSGNLNSLDLRQVGMSDEACKALFSTLSNGALDKLTFLRLDNNAIGDSGIEALADALSKGALPALQILVLGGNNIGDAGLTALADVCASGALDQLQVCWRPSAL